MKLLILYEELAPYFLVNIEKFAQTYQVPVLIVCKSTNPVAPFQFEFNSEYIEVVYRENYSFKDLYQYIKKFQPTVLMQSGWIFKPYFEITRQLKLPNNILLFDNQWHNTIRQMAGSFYFRMRYKRLFQKAFVPGNNQKEFAKKLGFNDGNIETGFYCCDTETFEKIYFQKKMNRKRNYTFLFAGRYAPEKNVQTLWNVFIEICEQYPNKWTLLCAGKGNVPAIQHPQIKHLGFLQPSELADILLTTDVFILPSKFEPWGVIIHEVTTAGLPVITSNAVGANDFFVRHTENGFIFDINCKEELKQYLIYMMKVSDEEYFRMSDRSYELSTQVTTQNWIKKIYHLCKI